MSFYCQKCRMATEDISAHRETYHPEPPWNDGKQYTLREAAVQLARQECMHRGHDWDLIDSMSGPTAIVCARCGESRPVGSAGSAS